MLSITKLLDLSNKDFGNLYFVGDIHGNFNEFRYQIKTHLENAIVIVCGDCGIGFNKPKYYENIFQELQQTCEKKNCCICFVRGNHDNPYYFNKDSLSSLSEKLIMDFDRVHIIKDYDLIQTKLGNILCIGGGISIDRISRQLNKDWWPGEQVKNWTIDDYNRLSQYNIDIVVSHTAPNTFFPMGCSSNIVNQYAEYDKLLKYDLLEEREYLDILFLHLMQNWRPTNWYYGHFHGSYYDIKDYFGFEIKCHGLSCNEFKLLYNIDFE